jgi:hypothetical protein
MPSQGAQPQPNMAGERRETSFHINKKKMMANKGPKKIAMAPKELE